MKAQSNDTIAAISTATSAAAVSMVRLSGERAIEIADSIFVSMSGKKIIEIKGYSALYGEVFDKKGKFDTAVALLFRAPKSYTGENVVELTVHGGMYLVKRLLRAALDRGARLAEAGEFTKRAYLNGKMSLSSAEATAALISAKGEIEAKAALRAADGRLSRQSDEIAQSLVTLLGEISAYCDYPDEDIVDVSRETLIKTLTSVKEELSSLTSGFERGSVALSGVDTVIVGSTNVGKSTIMNQMSGFEKSIVTDIAGTTRDIVEDTVSVGGFVLKLSDTAGIRETSDVVESMGVKRAKERIESAALIIAVFDSSREISDEDREIIELTKDKNTIAVINKNDLETKNDIELIKSSFKNVVEISAIDKSSGEALESAITSALNKFKLDDGAMVIINERQYDCVKRALYDINDALASAQNGVEPDMIGITIEGALSSLYELSGKKTSDAVVNEIFSKFCVGK